MMKKQTVIVICGLVLFGSALSYGSIVGLYEFETDNGNPVSDGQTPSVIDDSSGNGNNGTYGQGDFHYTSTSYQGNFGLSTPENPYGRLYVPFTLSSDGNTVEFYYKPYWNGTPANRRMLFVSKGPSWHGSRKLFIWIESNGDLTIGFENGWNWGSITTSISSDQINWSSDKWYYIAGIWEKLPDGSGKETIYIKDMTTEAIANASTTGGQMIFSSTQSYIGGDFTNDIRGANGVIDKLRTANEALSEGELMETIPEPATIALLAIGGLLNMKRR